MSITYLSDLERGVLENPTLKALRAIAQALRISLNELLEIKETDLPRSLPSALEEFSASAAFRDAIQEEARRYNRDPAEIRSAWLSSLGTIEIAGRRPRQPADYRFVFETIRRVLDS